MAGKLEQLAQEAALEHEISVLQTMREETRPEDFIGLWVYDEAVSRYNVLTSVIHRLDEMMPSKA